MISDPSQRVDVSKQKPNVLKRLCSAYEEWVKDVTKDGFDPIPIPIGYEQRDEVVLPGHEAYLVPESKKGISYCGRNGWANDYVTNWTDTDAYPYWEVDVVRPGQYEITLMYVCGKDDVGAKVRVEIGGRSVEGQITSPHDPEAIPSPDRVPRKEVFEKVWKPLTLGRVTLKKGQTRLQVEALSKPGQTVMDLKAVHVRRVD